MIQSKHKTGSPGYIARSVINGDDGNNELTGSILDDVLNGGAGNDILSGRGGNDWIVGGAGSDRLTGGAGNDVFVFLRSDNAAAKAVDYITDFSADDLLITDAKLFDSNRDDIITFGGNRVLDLTGGGQVSITNDAGRSVQSLEYDGIWHDAATGTDYFVYSLVGSAVGVSTLETL
ncbi:M10 family metallopeptidase C-terminal domain-containing protein [Sphingobium yanoikuyae]|uniref:M10 family metallopeptidase C-terminal domain-containing protein n=1 Tax=Sphingobium yanoikuyae TaxID=13690 RepID=UPI001F1C5FE8|nr:hypothetical protein [Sphingobium yanoikuyae]